MEKNILDFTVLIEQDEDGIYIAKVPELEGCYSQGKNLSEVLSRVREAIEVCLEGNKEEFNPLKFIGIQKLSIKRKKPLLK